MTLVVWFLACLPQTETVWQQQIAFLFENELKKN